MRNTSPRTRAVPGALALLLSGTLAACGNSTSAASYDDFCTGYVQVIKAEMARPLDVASLKKQVSSLRGIGVPSDLQGPEKDGLDAFLKGIETMPDGAKAVPEAPSDAAAYAFGAYTQKHCEAQLEKMIPSKLRSAPPQLG